MAAGLNLAPYSTATMFFISGLTLKGGETRQALGCPLALAYGLGSVLFLTSGLAPLALHVPFVPPEAAVGLAVFMCMPTTLSTGVVLTQAVRGNAAVALLLTVTSNLLSVASVPLLLQWALGPAAEAVSGSFSPTAVARGLACTVLAPLLAGIATQIAIPGVKRWRADNRRAISYVTAGLLAFIPWMQVSRASATNLAIAPEALAAIAAAGLGVHLLFLLINTTLTSRMRFVPGDAVADRGVRRAVVLCTSQKTLPIAIAVLAQLAPALGPGAAYAALSCVAAHLIQTVFDSALVSHWLQRDAAESRGRVAAQ